MSSLENASFPIRSNRSNIGITNSGTGMPAKFQVSDNSNTFSLARKQFFSGSLNKQSLLSSINNSQFSNTSYNYLGSKNMQSVKNGKPIVNNSSDLYINRKKNLAIARGSTMNKNLENIEISFKSVDKNTVNTARHLCRNSGYVTPKKVSQKKSC